MIPFNRPTVTGKELKYLRQVFKNRVFSGDGEFCKKCHSWLEQKFGAKKALLTPSCTHALEMAAILADIKPGDEVIMPSYTFVSTANAFALRGATIVFVDIRPDTMNIDEKLIEGAITEHTKAIVPVHYSGVGCEMDDIISIAKKHNLLVIEDAAQGMMGYYRGRPLGTIADIGCFSFHETKNVNSGEGGAILLNDERFTERAEIIREKGTDRSKFFRGQVDKYSWVDVGSSYLPNELTAAFLYAQFEKADKIARNRQKIWRAYYKALMPLKKQGLLELPFVPPYCKNSANIFYIKLKGLEQRTRLINFFRQNDISAVFHYVPLHSSEAGRIYGRFHGEDRWTTRESERLLRLPIFYKMERNIFEKITGTLYAFFEKGNE